MFWRILLTMAILTLGLGCTTESDRSGQGGDSGVQTPDADGGQGAGDVDAGSPPNDVGPDQDAGPGPDTGPADVPTPPDAPDAAPDAADVADASADGDGGAADADEDSEVSRPECSGFGGIPCPDGLVCTANFCQ